MRIPSGYDEFALSFREIDRANRGPSQQVGSEFLRARFLMNDCQYDRSVEHDATHVLQPRGDLQ